jgi:Protein of unknown function (DUF1566)
MSNRPTGYLATCTQPSRLPSTLPKPRSKTPCGPLKGFRSLPWQELLPNEPVLHLPGLRPPPTPSRRQPPAGTLSGYAACDMTARSKDSRRPDAGKLAGELEKCRAKFEGKFFSALGRNGSENCTTETSTAFGTYLDGCVVAASEAAGGAALPNPTGDLATCNTALQTCGTDLSTCDGSLTTCTSEKATCTTSLATAQGDLGTCTANLAASQASLGTCNGSLAAAQGSLSTCETSLAACLATPTPAPTATPTPTPAPATPTPDVTPTPTPCAVHAPYTDNGDGTVSDSCGLIWEKKTNDSGIHYRLNQFSWSTNDNSFTFNGTAASVFLATLNTPPCFAGACDWRLPTAVELAGRESNGTATGGIVELCAPCINAIFGPTALSYYWSSSTLQDNPIGAFIVDFNAGGVIGGDKRDNFFVRAVRTGP